MSDALGDRMKRYEAATRTLLPPHTYAILRVDGRAFHTYLRGSPKPYDLDFISDMSEVGADLCREVSNAVGAYGQSDEISLVLDDREPQTQPWFGGVVQKMASVAAGTATAALIARRGAAGRPHFDARVFTLPSLAEVESYLIWRQADAVRNSIAMAAQAYFSPRQLHGVGAGAMQDMLWRRHGINWAGYSAMAKRGWVVRRNKREAPVTYVHKRTGESQQTTVLRTFWEPEAAPHFAPGRASFWVEGDNNEA